MRTIVFHNRRRLALLTVVSGLFILTPSVWTQMPPSGVPTGSTLSQTLHYAAVATKEQARTATRTAGTLARNASMANYRGDQYQSDIRALQLQCGYLRERFNWMGNLALQARRPYAQNALAELDAGLSLIGELFIFLEEQYSAGTLDRATLVRTCRSFEDALGMWEDELKKSCMRMGTM